MLKRINWNSHNWLVHKIIWNNLSEVAPKYAKGRLLDIGCSNKPYESLTKSVVDEHIGLDHLDSEHSLSKADIIADAYDTTVEDHSFDTILSTSVLEHLERPHEALSEMYRILKSGGYLILTCPLFWHIHEGPRDFFRYTEYGVRFMLERAGFEIIEIRPLSGFVVTFAQEFVYFLNLFKRNKLLIHMVNILQWVIQRMAYSLNRYDKSYQFTWLYLVIAKKNENY
jgi:SAM-dependent methyltransferase